MQRAGTDYVAALAALAERSAERAEVPAQGREVARTALLAAAEQMVRLAPDDPVTTEILLSLQRAERGSRGTDETDGRRWVAWF